VASGEKKMKKGRAKVRPYKARQAAALQRARLKRALWRREALEMRDFVGY